MSKTGKALVILDGPRGVGKSTMAMDLVSALEKLGRTATYFKKGEPDPVNEHANMLRHVERFMQMPAEVVVVDRFVLTEWVLATYFERRHQAELYRYCLDVTEVLRAYKTVHALLYAGEHVLTRRLMERGTRQWDMHPSSLALWRVASILFPGVQLFRNESSADWAETSSILLLQALSLIDKDLFEQVGSEMTKEKVT